MFIMIDGGIPKQQSATLLPVESHEIKMRAGQGE